jgi:hypothetical protein
MDRCIHELDTFACADCRPRTSIDQMVYATPGGSVVHRRADCEMLARGQASVDSAGGRVGVINPVHRDKYPGRGDCSWCMSEQDLGSCKIRIDGSLIDGIVLNTRPLGYGHLAYLVRYKGQDGRVIEVQMKKSQLIDLKIENGNSI